MYYGFLVTNLILNTDLVSEIINKKLSRIGVDKNTTDDLINMPNTCQYFKFLQTQNSIQPMIIINQLK